MFGDEIWDEDRWEAFLREHDRRINYYMNLLLRFMEDHPPPDRDEPDAVQAWEADLRAFLLAHGLHYEGDEPFLLTDERFGGDDGDDLFPLDGPAEAALAEGPAPFHRLPVYAAARALADQVLAWTNALPGDVKDSTLVQVCSHLTQVPANLAKGHGIGYEQDTIGGNIACVKRGLNAANAALKLLPELRSVPYLDEEAYRHLYEQTFEVRNGLGLYVQELRARFDLGID